VNSGLMISETSFTLIPMIASCALETRNYITSVCHVFFQMFPVLKRSLTFPALELPFRINLGTCQVEYQTLLNYSLYYVVSNIQTAKVSCVYRLKPDNIIEIDNDLKYWYIV